MMAVGRQASVAQLHVDRIGLQLSRSGKVASGGLEMESTNLPNVYSVGDANE